LSTSKSQWVLVAEDICFEDGTTWTANHRRPHANYPDGGSDLHADGSVSWAKIERTFQITSYNSSTRAWYFYQDDLSSIPAATLATLKWHP
jgi:hypothetical protein